MQLKRLFVYLNSRGCGGMADAHAWRGHVGIVLVRKPNNYFFTKKKNKNFCRSVEYRRMDSIPVVVILYVRPHRRHQFIFLFIYYHNENMEVQRWRQVYTISPGIYTTYLLFMLIKITVRKRAEKLLAWAALSLVIISSQLVVLKWKM